MNVCPRLLLAAAVVITGFGGVDGAGNNDEKGNLNLYWENDIFARTDGQYTNGFKVWWLSADIDRYSLPQWGEYAVGYLPVINRPGVVRNLGLGFGQQIYTPDDITLPDPPEDDRPYAGWLYLAIAFHSKTESRIDSFEFNVGVVGPPSLAEGTQKTVHSWLGGDRPRGWDHQLGTEPGLQAIYERRWRAPRYTVGGPFEADLISHFGAGLGNIEVFGNTGATVRFGYNIPSDFGTNPLRRSMDVPVRMEEGRRQPFGAHLFAGVDGRYVAHDIFLDGNTFRSSRSVERRPWVADFSGGLSLNYRDFRTTYSIVYRTREFETQIRAQLFGSISGTIPF